MHQKTSGRAVAFAACLFGTTMALAIGAVVAQEIDPSIDSEEMPMETFADFAVDGGTAEPTDASAEDWEAFAESDVWDTHEKDTPVLECPPGLYADATCTNIRDDVKPYKPAHELWSDGAYKTRFIYLPPNSTIDTTNPNYWKFPIGTRLYKTFGRDANFKFETRKIEREQDGSWSLKVYAWFPDQKHVREVINGKPNWLDPPSGDNKGHDIPTRQQCGTCHTDHIEPNDPILGFSAIQLRRAQPENGRNLTELNEQTLMPKVNLDAADIPGDAAAEAALGYLHANCGHCHRPGPARADGKRVVPAAGNNLLLWVPVQENPTATEVDKLKALPFAQSALCVPGYWDPEDHPNRVASGNTPDPSNASAPANADRSLIIYRMSERGNPSNMPPLATEEVDPDRAGIVDSWINTLPIAGLDKVCK